MLMIDQVVGVVYLFLQIFLLIKIIYALKVFSNSVYDIGVTTAGLWPCMFCSSIKALRQLNFRGYTMRPLRFCQPEQYLKAAGHFKIIYASKVFSNSVYDIGVTVARLWPCIF
jgi:hypothetical protein